MPGQQEKAAFIKAWFNFEKKRYSNVQRLELLRRWIETCVSFEEYEMASVLRTERGKTMRNHRDEVNGKRGFFKGIKTRVKYALRKLKRIFKKI